MFDDEEEEEEEDEEMLSIRLECGWSGLSKDPCRNVGFDQSRFCDERIVLSGPYGDDVAFVDQVDAEEIVLGLSDGVSGTRHHGFDPYQFAHHLIECCLEEHQRETIRNSSSLRGVVHRAIRSLEKRDEIFGSATLCLMAIERSSSSLRSLNIGDSGFMLIRNHQLIRRSHPRYHRGSAPLQLATFPRTHLFNKNNNNHKTRFYQDRSLLNNEASVKRHFSFRPSDGEYLQEDLQLGDLLLLASDGLFDNLYEDSILQIIQNHLVRLFLVCLLFIFENVSSSG